MKQRMQSEAGFGVIAVLLIMGLVAGLATGLAKRVRTDTIMQAATGRTTKNFYKGESGLYKGMAEFRTIFANLAEPAGTDFDEKSVSLGSESVSYQLADPSLDAGSSITNPTAIVVPPGGPFSGLNSSRFQYRVTSWVGAELNPEVLVRAQFNVDNIPIFQFAAFYLDDLEIAPGPTMNLTGRVHTNGLLYLNAGNELNIRDDPPDQLTVQVSSGEIWRGRKNNGSCDTGNDVFIDALATTDTDGSLAPVEMDCASGSAARITNLSAWNGSVEDEVEAIVPPIGDLLNVPPTNPAGAYWTNADLRIVLDPESTMTLTYNAFSGPAIKRIYVAQSDGSEDILATQLLHLFMVENPGKVFYNEVPDALGVGVHADATNYTPNFESNNHVFRRANDPVTLAQWTSDSGRTDTRRGGFYDNREGEYLLMLNVDVQALMTWDQARIAASQTSLVPSSEYSFSGSTTDGGFVLFLSVLGNNAQVQNNYAVRVFDSAILPFDSCAIGVGGCEPTGLTVASDQAIFVQGDYNVRATSGTETYDPASFIGDTLNVLSNNWELPSATNAYPNDRASRHDLRNDRRAADTEINAAFLAGVDTTVAGGNYNGGLENYPRFHEDWSPTGSSQQALNYTGSFVSLGNPRFKNGNWVYGNQRYEAPVRNWDYDTAFNNPSNLPPLTPNFVFLEQILFAETFR